VKEEKGHLFWGEGIKKLTPAKVFFSNQLEELFSRLQEQLFLGPATLFASRLIIVPSPAVEQWLRFQLADRLGIASAFTTAFLVESVYQILNQETPHTLQHILFLAEKILQGMTCHASLFAPVQQYVQNHPQRIMILAKKLSYLFQRYSLYGVSKFKHPWQQVLWEESCNKIPALVDLIKRPCQWEGSLHVFGLNHLPPALFHFFAQQHAQFYFLSPCQEFWSDLFTEVRLGDNPQPLLFALGRVGRHMAQVIEESSVPTYEDYREDNLFPIQRALLELQPLTQDASIEIHAVSTPLREVEVLYQLLQPYLAQDVEPQDILIMAPDMHTYAPYLRMIFGKELVHLKEPTEDAQDPEIQALKRILNIPQHRWSASSVLRILCDPYFKGRWNLKQLETIKLWVSRTGINWGFDQSDRLRILGQSTEQGTWKGGLAQLFEELAYGSDLIDFPDAELLGELVDILDALGNTLKPLISSKLSPAQWGRYFFSLYQEFFLENTGKLSERLLPLMQATSEELYEFKAIWPLVEDLLAQRQQEVYLRDAQLICCDCLLPMRCLPAKIICLLGMHEASFPRHMQDSLDALQGCHEVPSQADFDRYLFLETVMSYRKKLFIMYQGRDPSDGTTQPPSQVLELLLPYVEHRIHPLHAYHEKYFTDHQYINTSSTYFAICQAKRHLQQPPDLFSSPVASALPKQEVVIDLEDLLRCVRSPIRHFHANIRFHQRQKHVQEDPLHITPLTWSKLRRLCLHMPAEAAIASLQKRGEIPTGTLFQALEPKILSQLMVAPTCCYLLQQGVQKVSEVEQGVFHVPALTLNVEDTTVHLVGTLEGVTSQGLILPDKGDSVGVMKWWPICLISHLAGISSSWIFSKDHKQKDAFFQDATPFLSRLITYYFHSQQQLSPLYPHIIAPLLASDLEKVLETFQTLQDPALHWALQTHQLGQDLLPWRDVACLLYQEVFHAWV